MVIEDGDRVNLVRQVLAAGLAWLFDTEQPPDALVRDGRLSTLVDGVRFTFVAGENGRAVLVVAVAEPRFERTGASARFGAYRVTNPVNADLLAAIPRLLDELGHLVAQMWGSEQSTSYRLRGTVHPTLVDAVQRFEGGCPAHGRITEWSAAGCGWLGHGTGQLVAPEWPAGAAEFDEYAAVRQVDEVDELVRPVEVRVVGESEAVRRVLAALREVLVFTDPDRLVPRRKAARPGQYRDQTAYLRDVRIRRRTGGDTPDTPR